MTKVILPLKSSSGVAREITPESLKADATKLLQRSHIKLIRHNETKFAAGIFVTGDTKLRDDIPTASTNGWDKFYNPVFIRELMTKGRGETDVRGLVLHENLHIYCKHVPRFRRMMRDPKLGRLVNAACDYAINAIIMGIKDKALVTLPEGGLYDPMFENWSVYEILTYLRTGHDKQGASQGTPRECEDGDGKAAVEIGGKVYTTETMDEHDTESTPSIAKKLPPKPGQSSKPGKPNDPKDNSNGNKQDGDKPANPAKPQNVDDPAGGGDGEGQRDAEPDAQRAGDSPDDSAEAEGAVGSGADDVSNNHAAGTEAGGADEGQGAGQDSGAVHGEPGAGEVSEADIDKLVNQQVSISIQQGSIIAGAIGADLPRIAMDAMAPEVDWRAETEDFMREMQPGQDDFDVRRYDRRWIADDYIVPVMADERTVNGVIAIDMSGSITDLVVGRFLSHVKQMMDQLKPESLRILWWDTKVCAEQVFDNQTYEQIVDILKPVGGGGTHVSCVDAFMRSNILPEVKPDWLVVLTDGYVEHNIDWQTQDVPTLWLVTENNAFNPPVGKRVMVREQE